MNQEKNNTPEEDKKLDNSCDIEYLTLDEDKEARDALLGVLSDDERKIKKTGFSRKTVLLIVLFGFLLSFGISSFALRLSFDGFFTHSSKDGSWDIGFIDMNLKEKNGGAKEVSKPTLDHHEATFNVSLQEPGDEITYDLTIKNEGNLDARLSDLLILPENTPDDVILFYTSGIKLGDVLDAGKSTHMTVTARYSKTHGSKLSNKAVQIILNYVQK